MVITWLKSCSNSNFTFKEFDKAFFPTKALLEMMIWLVFCQKTCYRDLSPEVFFFFPASDSWNISRRIAVEVFLSNFKDPAEVLSVDLEKAVMAPQYRLSDCSVWYFSGVKIAMQENLLYFKNHRDLVCVIFNYVHYIHDRVSFIFN